MKPLPSSGPVTTGADAGEWGRIAPALIHLIPALIV
jgi:hypothetical protein